MSQIHGKTKIELYNPNTKIKKIAESENVFQEQYVAKYLRNLGDENTWFSTGAGTALFPQLILGGILLFRDSIPVGTQYAPNTNKIIGCGEFNVSNSGGCLEMGSYNVGESSWSDREAIMTYDFATNQANGNINSICLTSKAGGRIGYGHPSLINRDNNNLYSIYQFRNYNSISVGQGNRCFYYNGVLYGYVFNYNQTPKTMTIYKKKINLVSVSIGTNIVTSKTYTLDMIPSGMGTSSDPYCYVCGDKVDFVIQTSGGSIPSGGNFTYLEYDITNDSFSIKTAPNNTPITIYGSYVSFTKDYFIIDGGSTNSPTRLQNRQTGNIDYELEKMSWIRDYIDGYMLARKYNDISGVYRAWIFNKSNGDLFPLDLTPIIGSNSEIYMYDAPSDVWYAGTTGANSYIFANIPTYLATINNLPSPITKTSSDTMKITYTLTEV